MDPPEQALVEVGAAALAAPSAAVAGLVAGLAGQDLTDASLALYLARVHAAGLSPAVAGVRGGRARCGGRAGGSGRLRPAVGRRVENRSGRPGRRVVSRGADRLQGQRVARGSRPPGRAAVSPRSKGRPLSASRAGYPVTVSALVARNRWPPAGPRLSRCRRRAGGSHRRCRATMHGARWQHGAPSLASATVADKAGVDHTTIFPPKGGRSGGE